MSDAPTFSDLTRAEILELRLRQWHPETFVPRDAVRYRSDGTHDTVPGGWDHEHCTICDVHICDKCEDAPRAGFVDDEGTWLCKPCHSELMQWNLPSGSGLSLRT